MTKKLVIVESPTKAKTIKRFLGKDYIVLASMGHVIDLPKSQFGINIEHDFEPKYITIRGKGQILSELKSARKKVDTVYLAADPDREGEAICWHLARVLNIPLENNCRVEFNEITKEAIKKSFKNPRAIDNSRVNAQQARRILDRLVGYKISPLLWAKVKKGLSAGRVQSVSLKLICEREKEIEKFETEEYWSITALLTPDFKKNKFEAKFIGSLDNKKIELESETFVKNILKEIKDKTFTITKIIKKERKKNPTPPFTTSSLQQEAARKLGNTAKKTMRLAQQLYEGIALERKNPVGLITYIRTDSVKISNEALENVRKYIAEKFGNENLPSTPRYYKGKKNAQEAHEAIRPTSPDRDPDSVKKYLNKDQFKLYKLIWDRFVASQMKSAILDTVRADIKVGNYIFRATGSAIKFPGFMTIYIEGKDTEEVKEAGILPPIEENQEMKLLQIEPKQHFTQPPPRFSEAMLVKTLEEKGIGRPSTYAPIIDTILQRGYVIKENKVFKPTELGFIVVGILIEYFKDIMDIDFTAQMEEKLDQVEEGEYSWLNLVKEFYYPFKDNLEVAEKEMEKIEIKDEVTDEICPNCGKNLVIKLGRFGKFLACPGFPDCRFTKPIVQETDVNCPKCSASVVVRKTKKGRNFFGCSAYPNCDFISWNKPVEETCPECSSYLVEKSTQKKELLQCSNKECKFKKDKG